MRAIKFIILLFLFCSVFADEYFDTKNGIKKYKDGDYDKALEYFKKAKKSDKSNIINYLNIGSTLYKQEKYEDAINENMNGMSVDTAISDTNVASEIFYNTGNAFYKIDSLKQAMKFYKAALLANPKDKDAKYNLELVMRRMRQSQSQQSKQNQKNQQNQKNKQGQQKKQQQNQGQQNQQQNQQNQQNQQQQKQGQQNQQEQQAQQQKNQQKKGGMTKEQAVRLMKAMENQEREELSNQMKNRKAKLKSGGRYNNPKDW